MGNLSLNQAYSSEPTIAGWGIPGCGQSPHTDHIPGDDPSLWSIPLIMEFFDIHMELDHVTASSLYPHLGS